MNRPALTLAALLLAQSPASADGPLSKPPRPSPTEVLEKAWPDHPEWVAMLVDILQGSQLGPGEGWFKKAVAQTRFAWEAAVMVYVREAHPTDGWSMESNDRIGVSLRQPRDYEERVEVARKCSATLRFGFPMLGGCCVVD